MNRPAIVLLAVTLALVAQTPQNPQTADSDVIHINVNLVQVDAVVMDSKQKPVTSLKASDFEILQDGKPQTITNFSFITTRADASAAPAPKIPEKNPVKGVAAPPVPLKPTEARRTIALVVDDLGLAFDSIVRVRQSLKKFVDQEMQPGDLVAVIRTGAGMGALQQFTADKQLLYAAIDRVKYNSLGRVGVSSFAPLGSGGDPAAVAEGREQIFAVGSLGAIRYVVDGLKELPGRKAVVLFSENMRLFYRDGQNPQVADSVRRLTDAANRASVVIYSIDPRGLQTYSLTAADNTRGMNAQELARVPLQRSREVFNSQDGLVLLAHDTGGLFFDNTNDIGGALHQAVEDSEGYYLIGYHPDSSTFDPKTGQPKFHKVEVHVKTAGLHVRTRSGFFGFSDSLRAAQPHGREAELAHALASPFGANGIHVRLTTMFSAPVSGPVLTSMLYIDAKDLKFTEDPDGARTAVIDVEVVTFGDAGQAVDASSRTYTLHLKDVAYQQAIKTGFVYSVREAVKKPGAYQVRVALRDAASEQVGSASQFIEVPDVSKGRLTLSSVVVRDYVPAPSAAASDTPPTAAGTEGTGSTAQRTFKPGQDVLYGYQILNAESQREKPQIEAQARVFRDGQEIFTGKPTPLNVAGQPDMKRLANVGVLKLGAQMRPGDYVLQVIVADKLANRSASQWVDFEVEQP